MKYKPLICKDCGTEIFIDVNMVMLKDELWESICDSTYDSYCDSCLEKRMGRKITPRDFKKSSIDGIKTIQCNAWWIEEQKNK